MSLAELVVIFIVALLVMGPQEWPKIFQRGLRFYRHIEKRYQNVQRDLSKALSMDALAEREEQAQVADRHYSKVPD